MRSLEISWLGQGVEYDEAWRTSAIGRDLRRVRNAKPLWSRLGTLAGVSAAGFDLWTNTVGLSLFGTLGHGKPDHATTRPASRTKPPMPLKPDGVMTFDRLTSVFLSGTRRYGLSWA